MKLATRTYIAFLVALVAAPFAQGLEGEGGSAVVLVEASNHEDADVDGLSDPVEAILGTNPKSTDTDGDGMDDRFEVYGGLNPLDPHDGGQDPDSDGLTNVEEYALGTLPFESDSDNDGWRDDIEVARGTDPMDAGSFPVSGTLGDVNADGVVDATDIQLVINAALGKGAGMPVNVNGVGGVDAIDVQLVINAALGA